MRVVVVGAGVVGLSVALELARSGHRVDVVARDLPRETDSATGPGLWLDQGDHRPGAHAGAGADARRVAWAEQTREALVAEAGEPDDPDAVVRVLPGTDAATGREQQVPVVDVPRHLDALVGRLLDHDGSLTRLPVVALPTGADVVVDCTGLGTRHFGADPTTTPVREQLAVVETTAPLLRWWTGGPLGATRTSYVVPAGRRVLVGAVVEPGEWERTVRPGLAAGLVERAAADVPELAGARVVGSRVGLWPDRPQVRLERVGDVVHCSGHGAAGLTLATGCAREVALLLA